MKDGATAGRIRALQRELRRQDAQLLILGLSTSMLYLSGFTDEPGERLLLLCVPANEDPLFVVPRLYEDQVRAQAPNIELVVWQDGEDPEQALREGLSRLTPRGVVLVDDALWASFLLLIQSALPACRFASGGEALSALRMRKDAAEVELLSRAGQCADTAYSEILETRFEGVTELEIAARLEEAMVRAGADGTAFATLVASGPNAALPHYRAGQRRIARGDLVILDFGCRVEGYRSDISRTVACGEPSADAVRVHAAIAAAQRAAVVAVRAGVCAGDVDRAARESLTRAGWGNEFIHRTGHGIGLDVHEAPYISEGNSVTLDVGMAFSVEPGVYLPGRFGVRIEDVVVVTPGGSRSMTSSARNLAVVR